MATTTGQTLASPEYRSQLRDVIWYFDGSRLPVNGIMLSALQDDSVETIELSGVQELRIVDLGLEPNIRISRPMRIVCRFRRMTKATLDRFRVAKEFDQSASIETGIYDSTGGAMVAATGLDDYSDYEWFFGIYRGWKSGSVTIYVDSVPKATGDAPYEHTLFLDDGGIQTTTPANWSGVTVTADYVWAPTVKVDKVIDDPVPGTYPQLFDAEVHCHEIVGLYG